MEEEEEEPRQGAEAEEEEEEGEGELIEGDLTFVLDWVSELHL